MFNLLPLSLVFSSKVYAELFVGRTVQLNKVDLGTAC